MKLKKEIIIREIAGEYILVPLDSDTEEENGLYVLSDVANRIIELFPDLEAPENAVDILMKEYNVDKEALEKDVKEFFERLRRMGFVD